MVSMTLKTLKADKPHPPSGRPWAASHHCAATAVNGRLVSFAVALNPALPVEIAY